MKSEIKHIEGLIDKTQLAEIVSEIVSNYNAKVLALEARIVALEEMNMLILAKEEEAGEEITP